MRNIIILVFLIYRIQIIYSTSVTTSIIIYRTSIIIIKIQKPITLFKTLSLIISGPFGGQIKHFIRQKFDRPVYYRDELDSKFRNFLFKSEPNIGWEIELKHSKIQYLIFEVPYVYSTNVCVPYI